MVRGYIVGMKNEATNGTDPMVIVPVTFGPDRIMPWSEAATQIGVTATPVPTFPVRVAGKLIELASGEDIENLD